MQISNNFKLEEFTRSDIAKKYGISNDITQSAKMNIIYLVKNLLQPLREMYGKPIHINSGFRCPELNFHEKMNGSKNSQHMTGEAADIRPDNPKDLSLLTDMILKYFEFDQIKVYPTFIHISLRRQNNRYQDKT